MPVELSTEAITALAAFASGVGSVVTGIIAISWERRRSFKECEQRIKAFHEGMKLRDEIERGPLT